MAHMIIPNNNPNIYAFFYKVTGDRVELTRLPIVAYEYTSTMGLTPLTLHPDGEVKDDTDADNFFYVGTWDYYKRAVLARHLNMEENSIKTLWPY